MLKIISTVGTSLFNNYQKSEIKNILGDNYESIDTELNRLENIDATNYDNQRYRRDIDKIKKIITNKWLRNIVKRNNQWEILKDTLNKDASAEVKSLLKILESENEYKLFLLSSDTLLSRLASEIIYENKDDIFKGYKVNIELNIINDLQVKSFEKFKNGLINLIEEIRTIFKNELAISDTNMGTFSRQNLDKIQEEFLFNISGGYKATLPYLIILAQLYRVDCKYIFEDSDEVITIPTLNIGIDEFLLEKIYLDLTSNLYQDNLLKQDLINRGLIEKQNQRFYLTALGELIRDYAENYSVNGKNVFGLVMEYKMFEFFVKNPLQINSKKLKNVERNVIYKKEFDLVLSNDEKNIICFCEIKAFHSFLKNKDKIISEYSERIQEIKNRFPNVKFEYHFYIYSLLRNTNDYELKEICKNIYDSLQDITVKFYKIFVKEDTGPSDNPYQNIVRRKIEPNDIEELKIN